MALTGGGGETKSQDGRKLNQRVQRGLLAKTQGVEEECLWVLSGVVVVVGEALVKHRCLVVWTDPPAWTVHGRLISSSTEQGSKGELPATSGAHVKPPLIGLGLTRLPRGQKRGDGGWRGIKQHGGQGEISRSGGA